MSSLGRLTLLAVVAALLLSACGGEPPGPEERIASLLERFEDAAARRDVGDALEIVSDSYADAAGRDKRAIKGLVLQYFLRNEAIHVLSRVRSLELADPPDAAQVVVAAALTGAPVAEVGELGTLSADLFRFELELALEDDDEWRIRSAHWRRGSLADFL